jgi:cysteine synthase A
MAQIDLTIFKERLENSVKRAKEQNIIIPTYSQMKDPGKISDGLRNELNAIGLWEVHPRNLFRITWKNEQKSKGGGFSGVNFIEFPSSLTGTEARIVALLGKWFPTGAHKVGAAFGCLVPRLVTGQFDPTKQKAVWPSTGNYCRGGAYDSALLGCDSIAILPEGMSRERFDWLKQISSEIIATPGSESNVKEIFDKCKELRQSGQDLMIFNQFEEFGNYLWHYEITGHAIEEVIQSIMGSQDEFRGVALTTGSAGTIGCGDYLKQIYPTSKIVASEALQCPTLLQNGFGAHRIEGIGDKHVPWIHNVKNTDLVVAIDDNNVVNIMRLFNEAIGKQYLAKKGVPAEVIERLNLLGFSGIANLLSAIKFAKHFEMGKNDIILTVLTDSMELYGSRIEEYRNQFDVFDNSKAAEVFAQALIGVSDDHLLELTYESRKRIHNLKYYTWVEQQGKSYEEIQDQWYKPDYWTAIQKQVPEIDHLIDEFNQKASV